MSKASSFESLRYPIGKQKKSEKFSDDQINDWINTIETFPSEIREVTKSLSSEELDWRYRPDGWTIRQVVHHCADSHMNSIIRFKLALTEEVPTIKPYLEDKWAGLPDSEAPISISLSLIDGLHARWVLLLKSMSTDDFRRKLFHPESKKEFTLRSMLGLYAWHCDHHLAHIKQALEAKGSYN